MCCVGVANLKLFCQVCKSKQFHVRNLYKTHKSSINWSNFNLIEENGSVSYSLSFTKGQTNSKWFFQADVSSKNEQTNSTLKFIYSEKAT